MNRRFSVPVRDLRLGVVMVTSLAVALLGVAAPANAVGEGGDVGGLVQGPEGPVEGLNVTLTDTTSSDEYSAHTGADGRYLVAAVPAGEYTVFFEGGPLGLTNRYYNNALNPEQAARITVTDLSTQDSINANLTAAGAISGTVSANGGPVAGALVSVTSGPDQVASVETAGDGTYTVNGLSGGTYSVSVDASGMGLGTTSQPGIAVTPGATTTHDVDLTTDGSVAGRVTDEDGAGVPDVEVTVFDSGDAPIGWATTDADGDYSLDGIPEGDVVVYFEARATSFASEYFDDKPSWMDADMVPVMAGETATADAVLALGGAISGTVTGPEGPAEGVGVFLFAESGGVFFAETDEVGEYVRAGLPAGDYTVEFDGSMVGLVTEYFDDAPTWDLASVVSVTAGETTDGIDAELGVGGSIAGTVTGPDGEPVAGVTVMALENEMDGRGVDTDELGNYQIDGLTPGDYVVQFNGVGHLASEYYDGQLTYADADPVTVVAGEVAEGIDAQLALGGAISGTVTDAAGNPRGGVPVEALDADGAGNFAITDAFDGSYTIGGLPAGSYTVEFKGFMLGMVSEYYDDVTSAADATWIDVEPGQTVEGIDAELAVTGDISGTVTDPDGEPVEGVTVVVRNLQYGFVNSAETDVDGAYTVTGLDPGDYKVHFQGGELGLLDEYYDDAMLFSTAEVVTVGSGAAVTGIDAELGLPGSISGTVTGPDGPLENVYVNVWGEGLVGGYAETDADGTYTATGLYPGEYTVCFYPDEEADADVRSECYDDQVALRTATPVAVVAGEDTAGIDAVLSSTSEPLFSDVPLGHPFDEEIEWLAYAGITTGFPDGSFHPSASIERQAMAAFLYRFAGEPEFEAPQTPTFVDVPTTHPFFTEVEWLASTGITTGWPDGTFRPMAPVERQAMAAFLYRYADEPAFTAPGTATFTDVATSHPFFTEIEWLASTEITTGWPDGTFRSSNDVERQAMAAFLMRYDSWLDG